MWCDSQVQRHSVLNEKNETVELCSSVECKGIIGNDGRHYILDLLRTFPPDLNFLLVDGEDLPPESQLQGFPRHHRHRLACLRQELIEAFVEHRYAPVCSSVQHHVSVIKVSYCCSPSAPRYLLFMKMAALQLMQQKANKDTKTDALAITETSGTAPETNADTTQTQSDASGPAGASEASADSTNQPDNSTSAASQADTDRDENSSKPTTNGPVDLTATQNGECKSPLAGKELEESIPGLAQAKELAETLVSEDGSCIGMSKKYPQIYRQDNTGRATLVDNHTVTVYQRGGSTNTVLCQYGKHVTQRPCW